MEKLTMLSVSKNEILDVIQYRLPEPTFVDADIELDEKLYYGNVFEEVSQDDLTSIELQELLILIRFAKDVEYVLITN